MNALIFGAVLGSTPAAAQVGSVQQPLVAVDSTWSTLRIPVCWENPTDTNVDGRNWSQDAVQRTWNAVSDVDFVGWDACTSADATSVRILIDDDGPHVKELGERLAGMSNGVVLNLTFAEWGEGCAADAAERESCIRAIAVHEFGHVLGFAHEHNRSDRRDCDREPQGTDGTILLTDYDPNSVMNYCSPDWNNDGRLTPLDVAGVRSVYGPYTAETPARFEGEVAIWARDDEVIGSETGSDEFPFVFELETSVPEVQTFSHCVGGEVRIDVELRAALLSGMPVAQFTATSELYEGTSCSTSDLEDWGVETESVETLSTGSIDLTTRLVNGELLGGDEGRVDIDINTAPDAVLERASMGECPSCDEASEAATFEYVIPDEFWDEAFAGCSNTGNSGAGALGVLLALGLVRRRR